MKNIHILPTDKPSRLYKDVLDYISFDSLRFRPTNKNIYITSDEEIKVGDWMIRNNEQPIKLTKGFFWDFGVRYYKIILTTDQDLIKDGVQAIPDKFLEWFVKNPSCEKIKVQTMYFDKIFYKIIIPKEESKLQCKDCSQPLEICTCIEHTIDIKQETLEKRVEWIALMHKQNLNGRETEDELFEAGILAGIEETKEIMYSEEDLKEAFKSGGKWYNQKK